MPIEETQKSYPSKGRRKKNLLNEMEITVTSNTQMKNRTANTKRVVCVPTCKGAVPGHAGGTVVRGISRELR